MDEFTKFFTWLLNFLPHSPFQSLIANIDNIPYLAEFNWFFPVTEIISVMEVWLTAVALFYLYSAIMRFVKIIS